VYLFEFGIGAASVLAVSSNVSSGRLAVVTLHGIAVAAEEYTIAVAAVTYQEHGYQKHYAAYGARFPL
jgi:hypothetical protein